MVEVKANQILWKLPCYHKSQQPNQQLEARLGWYSCLRSNCWLPGAAPVWQIQFVGWRGWKPQTAVIDNSAGWQTSIFWYYKITLCLTLTIVKKFLHSLLQLLLSLLSFLSQPKCKNHQRVLLVFLNIIFKAFILPLVSVAQQLYINQTKPNLT